MWRESKAHVAGRIASRWMTRLSASVLVPFSAASARADAPLQYLFGAGPRNVSNLTWGVLIIAVLVAVIVTGVLLVATFRKREGRAPDGPDVTKGDRPLIAPSGNPIPFIYAGLIASTLVLFGVTIWTMVTLADVAAPPSQPSVSIEVIGHQWWWEVKYLNSDPSQTFITANEIHIPAKEPVAIQLRAADVIHSFWVPALAGKTDLIPGQINKTWILADRAGTYRGQCTEYCGLQHAHMGLEVIATSKDEFDTWRRNQLRVGAESELGSPGQRVFMQKCAVCHTVRGTPAGGRVGPDLTHLMTRHTIAAATLPNRVGYLSGWIADPQHFKPGSKMPRLQIEGQELADVRSYLETLN